MLISLFRSLLTFFYLLFLFLLLPFSRVGLFRVLESIRLTQCCSPVKLYLFCFWAQAFYCLLFPPSAIGLVPFKNLNNCDLYHRSYSLRLVG